MTDEEHNVNGDETLENGEEAVEAEEEVTELSEEEQLLEKLKEAVAVTREDLGGLRAKLTITVPRELLDERMGEQFAELKREAVVPGFRKGHAPLALVEKRFKSDVGNELASQMVHSAYLAATEKEEIKPLGDPVLWVRAKERRRDEAGAERTVEVDKLLPIDAAVEFIDLPAEGSLTFTCELELKPEFELPKLEGIKLQREQAAVSNTDVDERIDMIRRMRGSFEPVEDGTVELDDMLYASMKMQVDGETVRQEDNTDLAARDMRLAGVPLKGLGEALKGAQVGGTVTFDAPVPEDHENVDLRGKTAHFEFVVAEIKRLKLPELDDAFVDALGFEGVDDFKSVVRSQMESQLEERNRETLRDQVREYLLSGTTLEVPTGMSQRQTDRMVARRMIEMYQRGTPEAEVHKALDQLKVEAAAETDRDLRLFFILERVSEELDLTVSEDEMNGAIASIAQSQNRRFDRVRDDLAKQGGLMALYLSLRDTKLLDALIENAEIAD